MLTYTVAYCSALHFRQIYDEQSQMFTSYYIDRQNRAVLLPEPGAELFAQGTIVTTYFPHKIGHKVFTFRSTNKIR